MIHALFKYTEVWYQQIHISTLKSVYIHSALLYVLANHVAIFRDIKYKGHVQGAAERTPQFGRGIASGGERVQWWGVRRRTAVYVPFSVYTMAWLGEHRAFTVEEFIKKMAGRR